MTHSNQQINVSQLFELIGRQTVELGILREQLAQARAALAALASKSISKPVQEPTQEPAYSE